MAKKSKVSKFTAKRQLELEEKLESQLDYTEGLERTVAQLEAELASCEEERDATS